MPTYLAASDDADADAMRTTAVRQLLWMGAGLLAAFALSTLESPSTPASGAVHASRAAGAAPAPYAQVSDQRLANGLRMCSVNVSRGEGALGLDDCEHLGAPDASNTFEVDGRAASHVRDAGE